MKKTLAIAALALFAFASCKKDYTCECVTTNNGEQVGTSSSTFNAKKKDAESSCDGLEASSGTLKTTCNLKD